MPVESMVMILATTLEDGSEKVLQRNFLPFRVNGTSEPNNLVITKSPDQFTAADWSIKHSSVLGGKKVWGMGSGYFEYEFILPEGLVADKVEKIEFRAELAARYPQEKYLDDKAEGIGMTIVSEKGTIPGYGKNSYPQTDEKLYGSVVTIFANNNKTGQVELKDDPADHNGLLSWMNQVPGREWGTNEKDKPWLLEEAGSYGYLVNVELDELAKKSALESGKVVIRLFVDEAGTNRGGLSVYGAKSGKYPMDPTVLITEKE
jgi:predicted transcriptional regulator